MVVKKRQLNLLNNLLSGIGIIVLGLIITIGSINMYTKVVNLVVYVFIIYGLSRFINFLLNKKIVKNKQTLISIILNIAFGMLFLMFPTVSLYILPILFSLYLLLNSFVKLINYMILNAANLKSRYKELFFFLIFFIFSIIFLFYPLDKINVFISIIGIYCILLGISRINEFIIDILNDKLKLKLKRKLRMTLPAIFEAFIPKRALKSINKYINYLTSEEENINEKADLEIFIHMSKYGFNQFGHIDIRFDGVIYSYGNYDRSSQKLFTSIGDGVLFSLDKKDEYIKFCMTNSRKTLVEYGVKLTEIQKEKVKTELNKIFSDTVEWLPPILFDKKNKIKTNEEYKDYASKLYNATNAKFYKFKNSKYKTYFVLGVNCTDFADRILKNVFYDILKLVGILSPGTYYEYLEENYKKKNSKIISKKIYSNENMGVLDVKDKK